MKRDKCISIWTLLLVLLTTRHLFAEQPWELDIIGEHGPFTVIDGKPYLLRKGEIAAPEYGLDIRTGGLDIRTGGLEIRTGTEIVNGKSPLCYSLDGDVPTVSLGKSKGLSAQWDFPPGSKGVSEGGAHNDFPIRAAEGKFKGWFLDWADDETEIQSGKQLYHVRRIVLSKEPKVKRMFTKFYLAP